MGSLLVAKKHICMKDGQEPLQSILFFNVNWVEKPHTGGDRKVSIRRKVFCSIHIPKQSLCPGAWELLQKVKKDGLIPMVVTGSGQLSLLERLEHHYPGMFHKELMVTAFDVKYGKPNPEPYLMALKKGGIKADEAVVVENAPLGVEAGHNAGIFTIAVNTGPLNGQVLLDAGADLLFPSMQALNDTWDMMTENDI